MVSGPAAKLTFTYILATLKNVLLSHDPQHRDTLKPPSCLRSLKHELCLKYKRAREGREQTEAKKNESEIGEMIEADPESERRMSLS